MHTRKGQGANSRTPIPGISIGLPSFKDSGKVCYMVEVLWSGSGVSNLGYRWDEVYFPPAEQTITEGEESVTLNLNGQIYGGVTKMFAFTTGATELSAN